MFSRRQFLQAAGIAVAAAQLRQLDFLTPAAPRFDAVYGRALVTTPVHAAPNTDAPLIKRLWSDTVVPIYGSDGDWYRLSTGYAQRENVQPLIVPARRAETPSVPPFWAEVIGALAIVRTFCSASAPIIARVGHGGVLRVIDYLPGDGIEWYGIAESEDGDLLGWTFSSVLSPARVDAAVPTLSLLIEPQALRLTVREADQTLFTAPISTNHRLTRGSFPITQRKLTDSNITARFGTPWSLIFGDGHTLSGAYWHNRFGAFEPGATVQVTPPLAKWLYPRAQKVIIS